MEMVMSRDEITESYRTAKNRLKQIGILADMNLCTKKEMREYLRQCGYEIYEPKGKAPKNPSSDQKAESAKAVPRELKKQPNDQAKKLYVDIPPIGNGIPLPFVDVPQDNVAKVDRLKAHFEPSANEKIKSMAFDEIALASKIGEDSNFILGIIHGVNLAIRAIDALEE